MTKGGADIADGKSTNWTPRQPHSGTIVWKGTGKRAIFPPDVITATGEAASAD